MDTREPSSEEDSTVSQFVRSAKARAGEDERTVVHPLTRRQKLTSCLLWSPVAMFVSWALTIPIQWYGNTVRSRGEPWGIYPIHYVIIVLVLMLVISLGFLQIRLWRHRVRMRRNSD